VKTRIFGAALLLLSMMAFSPIAEAQSPPTTFRVFGQVTTPTVFNLAKLEKLPTATENITYGASGGIVSHEFTGALLWDLLQSIGITVDSTIKNDILRKIVVVTGSDGYKAVFGAGEFDPSFGGEQIMIAYSEDGQSLGQDGFAQLIAPGDKLGGRFVFNIVSIEVRDPTK